MQPAVLIAMWAPDEKNPKVPTPSRHLLLFFFKYTFFWFEREISLTTISLKRTLSSDKIAVISWSVWFLKSNFQFMYLIITAILNVNFLARVLFLSFTTWWRSEKGFFRPPFLEFSFHTSSKEGPMSIFRMQIGMNPDHGGSSCPSPLFMDDSERKLPVWRFGYNHIISYLAIS